MKHNLTESIELTNTKNKKPKHEKSHTEILCSIGFDNQQTNTILCHSECDKIIAAIKEINNHAPKLLKLKQILEQIITMITIEDCKTLSLFSKTCLFLAESLELNKLAIFMITNTNYVALKSIDQIFSLEVFQTADKTDVSEFFDHIQGNIKLQSVYYTLMELKLNIKQCTTVLKYAQCDTLLALMISIRRMAIPEPKFLITREQLMAMVQTNSHKLLEYLSKTYLSLQSLSLEHAHIVRLMGQDTDYPHLQLINTIVSPENFQAMASSPQEMQELFASISNGHKLRSVYNALIAPGFNVQQCLMVIKHPEHRNIIIAINSLRTKAPHLCLTSNQLFEMIKTDGDKTITLLSKIYSFFASLSLNHDTIIQLIPPDENYFYLPLIDTIISSKIFNETASSQEFFTYIKDSTTLCLVYDALIAPGFNIQQCITVIKHSEHHNIIRAINTLRTKAPYLCPTPKTLLGMIKTDGDKTIILLNEAYSFFAAFSLELEDIAQIMGKNEDYANINDIYLIYHTWFIAMADSKIQEMHKLLVCVKNYTELRFFNDAYHIFRELKFKSTDCLIMLTHVDRLQIIGAFPVMQNLVKNLSITSAQLFKVIQSINGYLGIFYIQEVYDELSTLKLEIDFIKSFMGDFEDYKNILSIKNTLLRFNNMGVTREQMYHIVNNVDCYQQMEFPYHQLVAYGFTEPQICQIITHDEYSEIFLAIQKNYSTLKLLKLKPEQIFFLVSRKKRGGYKALSDIKKIYSFLKNLGMNDQRIIQLTAYSDFHKIRSVNETFLLCENFYLNHETMKKLMSCAQNYNDVVNIKQRLDMLFQLLRLDAEQVATIVNMENFYQVITNIIIHIDRLKTLVLASFRIMILINLMAKKESLLDKTIHIFEKLKLSGSETIDLINRLKRLDKVEDFIDTFHEGYDSLTRLKLNKGTILQLMHLAEGIELIKVIHCNIDFLVKLTWEPEQFTILLNDKNALASFAILIHEYPLLIALNLSVKDLLQLFKTNRLSKNIPTLKNIFRCNLLNLSSNEWFNLLSNQVNDNLLATIDKTSHILMNLGFTEEETAQLVTKKITEDALNTIKTYCQQYRELGFSCDVIMKLIQHAEQDTAMIAYQQLLDLGLSQEKSVELISDAEQNFIHSISTYYQLLIELNVLPSNITWFARLSEPYKYIQDALTLSNYLHLRQLSPVKIVACLYSVAFNECFIETMMSNHSKLLEQGFNEIQITTLYGKDNSEKFLKKIINTHNTFQQLALTAEDVMSIIEPMEDYKTLNKITQLAKQLEKLKIISADLVSLVNKGFFNELPDDKSTLKKLGNLGFTSLEHYNQLIEYPDYTQIIAAIVAGCNLFITLKFNASNLLEIIHFHGYKIIELIKNSESTLINLGLTSHYILSIAKLAQGSLIIEKIIEFSQTFKKCHLKPHHIAELISNENGVDTIETLDLIYSSLLSLTFNADQILKLMKHEHFLQVTLFITQYRILPGKKLSPEKILLLLNDVQMIDNLKAFIEVYFLAENSRLNHLDFISSSMIIVLKNVVQKLTELGFSHKQIKQLMPNPENEAAILAVETNSVELKEKGLDCNEIVERIFNENIVSFEEYQAFYKGKKGYTLDANQPHNNGNQKITHSSNAADLLSSNEALLANEVTWDEDFDLGFIFDIHDTALSSSNESCNLDSTSFNASEIEDLYNMLSEDGPEINDCNKEKINSPLQVVGMFPPPKNATVQNKQTLRLETSKSLN